MVLADSLLASCELDRYGENFFFLSESFLLIFSRLLFREFSSSISLGNLNDWLVDAFDSFDFSVEKFNEPKCTGLVEGGLGIGLSPL